MAFNRVLERDWTILSDAAMWFWLAVSQLMGVLALLSKEPGITVFAVYCFIFAFEHRRSMRTLVRGVSLKWLYFRHFVAPRHFPLVITGLFVSL